MVVEAGVRDDFEGVLDPKRITLAFVSVHSISHLVWLFNSGYRT